MQWRRTAAVQPVGALIAVGPDAPDRIVAAIAAKSKLFGACRCARGVDWIVLLAATDDNGSGADDGLLPRIAGVMPLYDSGSGLWLPVGTVLDVPGHAAEAVTDALLERHAGARPAVIIPRFRGEEAAGEADLYLLSNIAPLSVYMPGSAVGIAA